jgi:hypothetical protein
VSDQKKEQPHHADIVIAVGLLLTSAWILMLCLGGLHRAVPTIPAMSFGACLVLKFAYRSLVMSHKTENKKP